MHSARWAPRRLSPAALSVSVVVAAAVAVGSSAAAASPPGAALEARTASIPATVTGQLITAPHHTLRPGTPVPLSSLGPRAFANARVGFSLAHVGQADYPAVTPDGGRTWHTNGPALHLDAAQAPLAVVDPGAAGNSTFFAFGGGQAIDSTSDGGRHWWRAFLGEAVIGAVPRIGGGIIAFAQNTVGTGSSAVTEVYVSRDGGHHWHLDTSFGT